MSVKTCKGCGETKSIGQFHKNKKMRDGRINFCSSCRLLKVRGWKKKNPDKEKQYKLNWNKRNWKKMRAQKSVYKAVKSGSLIRPDKCEGCGGSERLEAHHEDYEQRLNVTWLCKKCHVLAHKEGTPCT